MTTKGVTIYCITRDPEGNVTGNSEASGHTEDEGITSVIPLGYMPQIAAAQPGDIILTVHQLPIVHEDVSFVSTTADEEAGTQTIVLAVPT
jgi:hypothetical protein